VALVDEASGFAAAIDATGAVKTTNTFPGSGTALGDVRVVNGIAVLELGKEDTNYSNSQYGFLLMGVDEASPTRKWHPIGTDPGGHLNVHILDAANVQLTSTLLGAKQSLDVNVANTSAIAVSGTVTANAGTGPFPVSDNASSLTVDAPVGTPVATRLSDGAAFLTTTGGRLSVDGSGVTQPVSGTVAATQSGTWTVQPGNTANTTAWLVTGTGGTFPVTGTVTANAGTNLNTSALALDASLTAPQHITDAAGDTYVAGTSKGMLSLVRVASAAPTLTAGQFSAPLLGTSGGLIVAGLAATGVAPGMPPISVSGVDGGGLKRHLITDTTGNQTAVGNVASGVADSGNPVKTGGIAATALPTAVANAQRVSQMLDKFGREVVVLGTPRDLRGTQTTTISASTTETTIVTAGGAGIFRDPVMILVANTATGTNTRIDFRDATAGTVRFSMQCPANQTTGFNIPGESIPQTTAANNWTAQCGTSTTDIRIYVLYENNQ
jgi:hypothetical protein